ncbi:MAG: hypothetical protein RLZZ381_1189, partial [Cyanobacteriota bacterium]
MKKLLLLCLFVLGIGFALFNFKGLAQQGEFNSIILDFKEDVPTAKISEEIQELSAKYNQQVGFNSLFSTSDRIYIV